MNVVLQCFALIGWLTAIIIGAIVGYHVMQAAAPEWYAWWWASYVAMACASIFSFFGKLLE